MQVSKRKANFVKQVLLLAGLSFFSSTIFSQVSTVEYGKNRVQYKKFKWRYYQTDNFNVYFSQGGLELSKFVYQIAEKELVDIEKFVESGLQRRANIVVYNSFEDFEQSNIGAEIDWIVPGGVTKFVNNKMVVYYNSDHNNLRKQIRQGIAKILVENLLFGDDLGEIASNQALLDLPKWLTDGYVSFAGENWSTELDDQLKVALLGNEYKNFYHFAHDKPLLAGHAFWYYIEQKYKKENVTYLLYLARIYRNLDRASEQICKKKFKYVLEDFMRTMQDLYFEDIKGRKDATRGKLTLVKDVEKRKDFFRFAANPNDKSFTYAMVEYKSGKYSIVLVENFDERKVLWRHGVLNYLQDINPNYPILSWDTKGTRLAYVVTEKSKIYLYVYDIVKRIKPEKYALSTYFDQVQDVKYMLDPNTLIFSATKNGHSDIYVYKIRENKMEQITNDVYDDIDPSFAAFPGKSGILFSSNRPSVNAANADTVLPGGKYNIFLVDNWNKSEFKQISQLTNIKYGNARFPTQYNVNHFTFVANESGINNRYAGFFKSQRDGLDTLVKIGDQLLRNPSIREIDSTLKSWGQPEPDSVVYFSITKDSTYTFLLTNYSSSIQESRIAGENGQVTEVRTQGDLKYLYKIKPDENTLRRRNVNAKPTDYIKRLLRADRLASGTMIKNEEQKKDSSGRKDLFESEFENEKEDTVNPVKHLTEAESLTSRSKLFPYTLKFNTDYLTFGVNNTVLFNRYQPYNGGFGPVYAGNNNAINALMRVGVSDLMEDVKFIGAFRPSFDFDNIETYFAFQNNRRRFDWGLSHYRSVSAGALTDATNSQFVNVKDISNIFTFNLAYALNKVKSIRFNLGYRVDRTIYKSTAPYLISQPDLVLKEPDFIQRYSLAHIEYVHDNTLNPAQNIWKGLRWKTYLDWNVKLGDGKPTSTYIVGVDARHYLELYRNIIWAVRGSAEFSWGDQKFIYYLGGVEGWLFPKFIDGNRPAADQSYAYQTLAVNVRGFNQNVANGNNNIVINSEIRVPVFATFLNKPINNAFIRNFQIIQFFDLGTAWNGAYNKLARPSVTYVNGPVTVRIKEAGLGPFVGGYGFGARSTLLGYFVKFDAGWPMSGFFNRKPVLYVSLGLDF